MHKKMLTLLKNILSSPNAYLMKKSMYFYVYILLKNKNQ